MGKNGFDIKNTDGQKTITAILDGRTQTVWFSLLKDRWIFTFNKNIIFAATSALFRFFSMKSDHFKHLRKV